MTSVRYPLTLLAVLGASLAVLASPGIAQAADREKVDINSSGCGSDCTNWEYIESASHVFDGPRQVLGADGKTCPGSAPTVASASVAKTIGHSWSWDIGGGADLAFLQKASASVTGSYGQTVSESVTTGTSFSEQIPQGEIGHMSFIPKMYHSEGVINWTEEFYDEFNSTADFTSDVSSDTPMKLANGEASGVYDLDSRLMTPEELQRYC